MGDVSLFLAFDKHLTTAHLNLGSLSNQPRARFTFVDSFDAADSSSTILEIKIGVRFVTLYISTAVVWAYAE